MVNLFVFLAVITSGTLWWTADNLDFSFLTGLARIADTDRGQGGTGIDGASPRAGVDSGLPKPTTVQQPDRFQLPSFLVSSPTGRPEANGPLTICQGPSWSKTAGRGWTNYSCKAACSEQTTAKCGYQSRETDSLGRPLLSLAFVVNGAAGEFRFNLPVNQNYTAGLLTHGGSGGTIYPDFNKEMKNLRKSLEQEGLLVVAVKWHGGTPVSLIQGWFAHRQADEQSSLALKSQRPAAVMRWVHDNLLPNNSRFGTMGCSAGSIATLSAVYWQGLDDIVDYQLLGSGPPIAWDMNAVCGGQASAPPPGVCELDPLKDCSSDNQCASGRCALPATPTTLQARMLNRYGKSVIDYLNSKQLVCLKGKTDEVFNQSSFRFAGGDWQYDHPVDFIIGAKSENYQSTSAIFATAPDDTEAGITFQAGNVFRQITTSDPLGKRWLVHNGPHCGWTADPQFLESQVKPAIVRGLKL